MRPYLSLIRMRCKVLIQYRIAALAGLSTQFVFGMVRVAVLIAFYALNENQPMTLAQSVSYTWIGQAMLGMLPWSGERDIMNTVRSGQIAYEVLRPLDLYNHWFARALAFKSIPTMLKAVPMFVIALFLLRQPYNMQIPEVSSVLAWVLATVGALILSTAITNVLQLSLLWTVAGDGIMRLLPSIVLLCSGMTIPLALLPDWLGTFIQWLPFAGLVDWPARIFCGNLPPEFALKAFPIQLLWAGVFVLGGRKMLTAGMRRVVVQGG